jgi:Zn-finger nucleic acid-binding protein
MIALQRAGVEIDFCASCKGTWLDAGELETIAELAGVAPGGLRAALEGSGGRGRQTRRRCPRCPRRLTRFELGTGKEAVELERCAAGHGLWLDQGEIGSVISSVSDGEGRAVASVISELLHYERRRER